MPGPGIITYIALIFMELMVHGCDKLRCGHLPRYLYNAAAMFLAQNLACAVEYFGGQPNAASVAPTILLFAPGAGALVRVLNQMYVPGSERCNELEVAFVRFFFHSLFFLFLL